MVENDVIKRDKKKWESFWKRYVETYPRAYNITNDVCTKIEEMNERASPFIGEETPSEFYLDEEGKIRTSEQFFLMFGALGETILRKMEKNVKGDLDKTKDELQKMQRLLKYAIPDLEDLIECPHCSEFNPPDKKYCVHCQEIIKEDLNEEK